MNEAGFSLRIYFATGWPGRKRRPILKWAALARRNRHAVYVAFLGWLLRVFTRGEFNHVFIGTRGSVLDPSALRGDRIRDEVHFIAFQPALAWQFHVPTPLRPRFAGAITMKSKTPVRAFLRWVTRGRVQSRDCVSTACSVLRTAGVDVPRRVVTPGNLWDFLRSEGYAAVELGPQDTERITHE